MPSTSPACSEKLMSDEHAADAERARRAAARRRASARTFGKVLGQIAVDHQPHELGHGRPRRSGCVVTWRPSRSTVMRRPMRNTSSSRCEM